MHSSWPVVPLSVEQLASVLFLTIVGLLLLSVVLILGELSFTQLSAVYDTLAVCPKHVKTWLLDGVDDSLLKLVSGS